MTVHANQVIENDDSTETLLIDSLFTPDHIFLPEEDSFGQLSTALKDSESDKSIASGGTEPESDEPLAAVGQQSAGSTVVRVLLMAEACNPDWPSVPLVGYNQARALAERKDLRVTLVTHERNRANLEADELMMLAEEVVFINSDAIARPF